MERNLVVVRQYGKVRDRLRDVEFDPFIQECMAIVPAGTTLGACCQIVDTSNLLGVPLARLAPPAPNRLLLD